MCLVLSFSRKIFTCNSSCWLLELVWWREFQTFGPYVSQAMSNCPLRSAFSMHCWPVVSWACLCQKNYLLHECKNAWFKNALFYSGIIPLYLSTLGETKLPNSIQHVPYPTIGLYISYTIFPLLIGILIKCGIHCICTINPNKWFVTILRCLSLLYIVSITGYAIASVWDLLAPSALAVSWRVCIAKLFLFFSRICLMVSFWISVLSGWFSVSRLWIFHCIIGRIYL